MAPRSPARWRHPPALKKDGTARKFRKPRVRPAPVAACLDCGLPYAEFPLDVVLPRAQWLEIHPADGGLLCACCIVKRAAKVPGATVVHAIIEIAPHRR